MKKKSTLGNKILAVCLLILSVIPIIMEKEATGFILMCMVAIPLFFAKEITSMYERVHTDSFFFTRNLHLL